MRITRTFDPEIVKSVMLSPEIWETVAEDNQLPELFEPEMVSDCWLQVAADDELVGLYNIHATNAVTLEIHCQILPEYREEHAKESSRHVLQWILDNAPEYEKVIAQIPTLYPEVKHFTLNAGFQEEGLNRLSYRKNGTLYDQWLLGITKAEIEAFLGGMQ